MIIDAKDLILGRVCTVVAKRALLSEEVKVINVEEAVITGSKKDILAKYEQRRARGEPTSGPFIPTKPDRFVRRAIRGMLPYKQEKGRSAFERIMCYIGVPKDLKEQKAESIESAHVKKIQNLKVIKVKEICRLLRGKS